MKLNALDVRLIASLLLEWMHFLLHISLDERTNERTDIIPTKNVSLVLIRFCDPDTHKMLWARLKIEIILVYLSYYEKFRVLFPLFFASS